MPIIIIKLVSLLKISRFFISSIAGLVSLSTYINTSNYIRLDESIFLFIVVSFTSAFGFSINDYFDREKDLVNHSNRVLPSKALSIKEVIIFNFFICFTSLLCSYFISMNAFLGNLFIVILLVAYSFINNKFGFIANIITAVISAFTIVYGMVIGEFELNLMIIAIAAFFLILGREILLDIRDLLADKHINKTSIPVNYGSQNAIIITTIFFILHTGLVVIAGFYNSSIWYLILVTITSNLLIWFSFIKYFRISSSINLDRFLLVSRLSFLLLAISLVIP